MGCFIYVNNGKMSAEERKEKIQIAYSLFNEGYSTTMIAKKLGCHPTTVWKWLKLRHIDMNRNKYSIDLIDKVAEMYQTMGRGEIAEKLGMKKSEIKYIINYNYIRKGEALE